MKHLLKFIAVSVLALALLCFPPLSAGAAEATTIEIPVEIEQGGTAIIITEVNCPLPEKSSIEVPNGMTENIKITFTEPGYYNYTVRTEEKTDVGYSPAFFRIQVAVTNKKDGSLQAVAVISREDIDTKSDVCKFVVAEPQPTEVASNPAEETLPTDPDSTSGTQPVTNPDSPSGTQPPTAPQKNPPTSRPKTGDDSMLDLYLFICIVASAGLFALSVAYTVSTNKLINRHK